MPFTTYYTNAQLTYIVCCSICLLLAIFLFKKGKYSSSVLLLVISAFFSRYLAASLDPFLHMWDEQYHALVAKNLSENMLKPVLYKNLYFGYDYKNWAANNIWVHKQPWFLWQMALAVKIFGCSEISIRIPSVIMSSLMIFLVYRIGSLVSNKKVGWYSAFLCAACFFQIEFVSGNMPTDHNDVAFMFYVSCSIWAFFEYMHAERKMRWVILIGLFAGIAVLNKWLVGLLIFSGWFIHIASDKKKRSEFLSWKHFGIAVFICFLVFLPWQFYIFHAFPTEAAYEFEFNSKHLTEVVEGHYGNNWFHIDYMPQIYGKIVPFLVIPGIVFLFRNSHRTKFIVFISLLLIVYSFYTIAVTKMMLFTLCVAPLMFVVLGSFMYTALNQIELAIPRKYFGSVWTLLVIITGAIYIDTDELERRHSVRFDEVQYKRHLAVADAGRRAGLLLTGKDFAVFNTDPFLTAEFTFYSGQTGVSACLPTEEQIRELKSRNISVAIFYKSDLPDYIKKDKELIILPKNFSWIYE